MYRFILSLSLVLSAAILISSPAWSEEAFPSKSFQACLSKIDNNLGLPDRSIALSNCSSLESQRLDAVMAKILKKTLADIKAETGDAAYEYARECVEKSEAVWKESLGVCALAGMEYWGGTMQMDAENYCELYLKTQRINFLQDPDKLN